MFSDEELALITAEHVYKFMILHGYGKVDPCSAEDNHPVKGCTFTLK